MDSQAWRRITPEEQAEIDGIVSRAAATLRAAGFEASGPRFPFAMHHERLRGRLRSGTAKPKHSDVALLLNVWAGERDFAPAYAWQAVMGAVEELEARAGKTAPATLREAAIAACQGETFERWARGKASAA